MRAILHGTLVGLFFVASQAQAGEPIRFAEHLLVGKLGYVFGVAAADLDGDGDLDLTSPDIRNKSHSTLYWFRNDGRGNFERMVVFRDEPGWFERHAIGDINQDGRPDVVIINNLKGNVVWFANSGKPSKGPWKRYVISNVCPRAYDVALADLDGDGDLDAATSGYTSNEVNWYENPGKKGLATEWKRRSIDQGMIEARTLRAGDINGDGRVDLVATAVGYLVKGAPIDSHRSQIAWYENTGNPANNGWKKHLISRDLPAAIHGQLVDMDKDGDPDLVMAHGMRVEADPIIKRHQVVWYENVRRGKNQTQWKQHKVGPMPYAFEAVGGDIDGDGDVDIAATSWSKGDRVCWFENLGQGKWKERVVRTKYYAANQIVLADLDGDKRLDIIASADDGSRRIKGSLELRWWQQKK